MKRADDNLLALQSSELSWIATRKDPRLFEAVFDGEHIQLRLNDFPDEPIFTVFFRDREIDIEESPKKWRLIHNS
ncbi:MAG: hypothetical protein P4L99_29820 [Chthoniobacter sp.]|nr:hypothetical protein [Chthoniobacter sp.]